MQIKMDYGHDGLMIDVPDEADVYLVRTVPALHDEPGAIQHALRNPIQKPALNTLVRDGMQVLITHTDITRATPNARLLPVIIEELERCGVKREAITLLNGLGTHRPQTRQELIRMLGSEIVENYRCLQHDAYDDSQLVSLGTSQHGHPLKVNRLLVEADLNILTGFIEPHFFAGYSGGPKAVLPGLAGAETVIYNHSPSMIADPQAEFNVTEGNPIWEEMKEAALRIDNTFLVNVTLDRENRITGVFAGDVIGAHAQGCQHARQSSLFTVPEPYDLVITSNSGYPLDQNLYQCVKGLAAGKRGVRKGGAILLLAACEEGLPEPSAYARLLNDAGSPQDILNRLTEPGFIGQDVWQVQIQAQVQAHADVYLYSEGLSDEQVKASLLTPWQTSQRAINELIDRFGPRVCVLPQGPLTILEQAA